LFAPAAGLLGPSAQRGRVQNPLQKSQGDKHSAIVGDPLNPGFVFVSGSIQSNLEKPDQSHSQAGNTDFVARIFYVNTALNERPGQQPQVVGTNAGGTAPHGDSRTMVFVNSANGGSILEADDGGIYRLINPTNAGGGPPRRWVSLN